MPKAMDRQATPDVFSVELFGSWDNFDKSYYLTRDKRAGAGQWRGCHTFENITCDGDLSNSTLQREGALMMGGTYWYYVSASKTSHLIAPAYLSQYLLNGTTEFHDPNEPSTTFCPSLPGQSVNILEVPVQTKNPIHCTPNSSTTSLDSLVFTLDPRDKYMPLRRAATTSAVREKARLLDPTNVDTTTYVKRLRQIEDLSEPESPYEGAPLRRQRSVSSLFSKLRRTRSAGSGVKESSAIRTGTSWSRKLISRASLSRKGKVDEDVPEVPKVPKIPEDLLCMAPCPKVGNPLMSSKDVGLSRTGSGCLQQPTTPSPSVKPTPMKSLDDVRSMLSVLHNNSGSSGDRPKSSRGSGQSFVPSFSSLAERGFASIQCAQTMEATSAASATAEQSDLHLLTKEHENREGLVPTAEGDEANHLPPALTNEKTYLDNEVSYQTYTESSAYSTAPSEYFSPCLASNTTASGQMSPIHLAQPDTPDLLELNDEEIRWKRDSDPDAGEIYNAKSDDAQNSASLSSTDPIPRSRNNQDHKPHIPGFQGYSLPHHDQGSTATIKKVPSLDLMAPKKVAHRPSMQHLVQSWDDGAEQRMENLSTMMEEMAYLGDLIN